MKKKLIILNSISAMLIILRFTAIAYAKGHTALIEKVYSEKFYLFFSTGLSRIANLVPFSLGETIGLVLIGYIIWRFIRLIIGLRNKAYREVANFITIILFIICFNIFYYDFAWGLNNYRNDTKTLFELPDQNIEIEDLVKAYAETINKANALRAQLQEDEKGVVVGMSKRDILKNAYKGYKPLSEQYSYIPYREVRAKALYVIGRHFNRSGYSGVYLFYVSEPNVNAHMPAYLLPYTACHEIAHQKGFAYEDDANFISFLACREHEETYIQYSGYYGIMKYLGNAIYDYDKELFYEMANHRSEGVKRDLQNERDYWEQAIVEEAEKFTEKINDTYLKANNQSEGVLSYNRVVELIVLEYLKANTL